jgi:hypothetical protein
VGAVDGEPGEYPPGAGGLSRTRPRRVPAIRTVGLGHSDTLTIGIITAALVLCALPELFEAVTVHVSVCPASADGTR